MAPSTLPFSQTAAHEAYTALRHSKKVPAPMVDEAQRLLLLGACTQTAETAYQVTVKDQGYEVLDGQCAACPAAWCLHATVAALYAMAVQLPIRPETGPEAEPALPTQDPMQVRQNAWVEQNPVYVHTIKWNERDFVMEHMVVVRANDEATLKKKAQPITAFVREQRQRHEKLCAERKAQAEAERQAKADAAREAAWEEPPARRTPPPAREPEEEADPGWCPIHQTEMRRHSKDGEHWYSHKDDDDNWCNGGKKRRRKAA